MASHRRDEEGQEPTQPLLPAAEEPSLVEEEEETAVQAVISQTFKSAAHLAKLLPTGTVLAFQLLSPIVTNVGHCGDADRAMTAGLLALCGIACFVLSFTDSLKDASGKVRYGIATANGFLVIDSGKPLPPEVAVVYKIKPIDFIHAFMSVLVFAAVALFDNDVVKCFYPVMTAETRRVLTVLPVGMGVVGSGLFVTFPSTRQGIGFPLTPP